MGPLAGSSPAQVDAWGTRHALAQARPGALPPHRYVMMLEPFTWVINNNADGASIYAEQSTTPVCEPPAHALQATSRTGGRG